MRILNLTIDESLEHAKVKDVLSKGLFISDSLCSKLKKRENAITVNGHSVYTNYTVKIGDILSVIVSDEKKREELLPIEYPLDIIYENDDFLIINKPSGLAIHPVKNLFETTLENAVAFHLRNTDDNPHPVSRLDRGTTGIISIAKSGWAHNLLKISQRSEMFHKKYLALCLGEPFPLEGTINVPIGFEPGSTYKRIVSPDGATAVSEYKVIDCSEDISLVELIPRTGRTHQLRVHMAYIGHPLLGDWLYGKESELIRRPALHSSHLAFINPFDHKEYVFNVPLPDDMGSIIKQP